MDVLHAAPQNRTFFYTAFASRQHHFHIFQSEGLKIQTNMRDLLILAHSRHCKWQKGSSRGAVQITEMSDTSGSHKGQPFLSHRRNMEVHKTQSFTLRHGSWNSQSGHTAIVKCLWGQGWMPGLFVLRTGGEAPFLLTRVLRDLPWGHKMLHKEL
jgi:hypothetical protein